ncbi:MAG: purine-nucleoside phosphorylase [Lachnospiraceae bacterium]
MNSNFEKLEKCYESVREKISFMPEVALVLGSGLGNYGTAIQIEAELDYHEIQDFPVSTVEGHVGKFLFGYVSGVPVVCMQGRVHYYEGYDMSDVVLPIRLMHKMGAKVLFLTNAAGGINLSYAPGDFMMITDHISTFIPNPLIGENSSQLGERFPDMSHVYDEDLQNIIRNSSKKQKFFLKEGVYAQLTGPSFETPQEIRMLRTLGADAVGMSTVCEAIAGNHCGMKICGISFISNYAAGITRESLSDLDVQKAAHKVADEMQNLVTDVIKEIHRLLKE